MRYILFTTTKSSWYADKAYEVEYWLNQTKGREVEIDVVHVSPPRNPQLIVDSEGDTRFTWDWFQAKFPVEEYDGVGFHFTPYYKKKWGLSKNGSKHTQNKDYPEFWFCSGREDAKGYDDLSNFVRLFVHEVSHFDEDVDDGNGNRLVQETVHVVDYEMKKIQYYPLLVDYRGYLLKRKVNKLINRIIDFVRSQI